MDQVGFRKFWRGAALGALALAAACASGTPATPEQVALESRRLLQPFLTGGEVGCQELFIEMSPNFLANVGNPSIDVALHSARKEPGDGYVDTVWTNKIGDLTGKFVVTIGEKSEFTERGHALGKRMTFTVLNQVRLRIHDSGRMRLDVEAKGQGLLVYQDATTTREDLVEFRIADGVLRCR